MRRVITLAFAFALAFGGASHPQPVGAASMFFIGEEDAGAEGSARVFSQDLSYYRDLSRWPTPEPDDCGPQTPGDWDNCLSALMVYRLPPGRCLVLYDAPRFGRGRTYAIHGPAHGYYNLTKVFNDLTSSIRWGTVVNGVCTSNWYHSLRT